MQNIGITDWISILSIVASLVTAICTALFFYKKQSIINAFNKDLESHKATLAKEISRSSTTLEERIKVMKEVLKHIAKLNSEIVRLQSYNYYECKNNLKFNKEEACEHKCDNECIVHLWDRICQLDKDVRMFDEYITSIMPLISVSAELVLKSYMILIKAMNKKAIETGTKKNGEHRENMLNALSFFLKVDLDTLKETYDKLIFMYRIMLNVPVEEYPIDKLYNLIKKNNSIVDDIIKM